MRLKGNVAFFFHHTLSRVLLRNTLVLLHQLLDVVNSTAHTRLHKTSATSNTSEKYLTQLSLNIWGDKANI